jgi:hypothetical protein
MTWAVVHFEDGRMISGGYDGYGRIDGLPAPFPTDLAGCWRHYACWRAAGRPGFTKASENSDDQGYFFDEGAHDMEEPT